MSFREVKLYKSLSGCPLCQFRLDKSRYRMQAKLEGVTYDEIFNRGRALADPTSPYSVERVSRSDTRLLERILDLIPESGSLVLVGDGEEQDTARILVKMTLEASRLGKGHVVGLSVEDVETAEHIARAARVLPYEGAIRSAEVGHAVVIFATDLHGVLAVASSLLHRPCLPIVLCYPDELKLKERLMASRTSTDDFSEDDPTAYGRLAVLAQMGWTIDPIVERPPEDTSEPVTIEATRQAGSDGLAAVIGEGTAVVERAPHWLGEAKKKTGGVLLAARGWEKPAESEPFHPVFDTVVLLRPRLQDEASLGHDDLILADAVLRMCFSDGLSRSRPVAKYAARLWPLADMGEVFAAIGKDPKTLPGDLEPADWVRLIHALVESERRHEAEEEDGGDEAGGT